MPPRLNRVRNDFHRFICCDHGFRGQPPPRDEICEKCGLGGRLFIVNGVDDHLHLLASIKATTSVAEIVGKLKGSSSKWIHDTFPDRSRFEWQRGYAAFSVSQSQVPRVATYIERQKVHHEKVSFRDEFLRLLQGHGISPDEKYLWT